MKLLLSICVLLVISIKVVLGQNSDCALIVPENALTADGMAQPWLATAVDPAAGPCNNANPAQTSFVQGTIVDLDTGRLSVYNPLAIDVGASPAFPIIKPVLPPNYVAGFWFGTNAGTLTLMNTPGTNSLAQAQCVNGGGKVFSIFGQFAYCNAPTFWDAIKTLVAQGLIVPPPLLQGANNFLCPSTRDFGIVDQDQSDNVITTYLVDAKGKIAQDTVKNRKALIKAGQNPLNVLANGSDNRLVGVILNGAFGCTPYSAPDLADPGQTLPSVALNELQAAVFAPSPVARIPINHAMTLTADGLPDLEKMNSYRRATLQVPAQNAAEANGTSYCVNLYVIGAPKILGSQAITVNLPSPDPANTPNLFAFLIARYNAAVGDGGLNCVALLNKPSPLANALSPGGAAAQALNADPVFDPPTALIDAPAGNGIDPATLAALCADPINQAPAVAAGFKFDGASFGIGIGAAFGVAIILATTVTVVKKSRQSADQAGRVASDFGGVRT